jgi:hypothetical protein
MRSATMLQVNESARQYTDAIVTNVWADGVNRAPCFAFTHDPMADADCVKKAESSAMHGRANRIAAAKVRKAELDVLLLKYKIVAHRLVYREPANGGKYRAECKEDYEHFIKHYQHRAKDKCLGANCFLVHDAGNAYKEKKKAAQNVCDTIMKTLKVGQSAVLPPIVHHAFSVNDHSLHAVAKGKAKSAKVARKLKSDLEFTLALMHEVDAVAPKTIEGWFTRNYAYAVCDKGDAKIKAAMSELLDSPDQRWIPYHSDCLEGYFQSHPAEREKVVKKQAKQPKQGKVPARNT